MKNRSKIKSSSLNVKLQSVRSIPGEILIQSLQHTGTHLKQLQGLVS